MRSRAYRRNQNPNRRKAIGAFVVSGVLVAAGLAGVQFANASTTPKAADVITVQGQQFDVSQCKALEISGQEVLCDGKKLDPQQQQGANDAATASAQALETACDTFAADAAAADGGAAQGNENGNAQGNENGNAQGNEKGAAQSAAAKKALQKKLAAKWWAKALKGKADPSASAGAGEDQNAGGEDQNAGGAADQNNDAANAAVASAQKSLLQACLALADAKAAAGIGGNAGGNAGDQGADNGAGASADPSEEPSAEPSASAGSSTD